MLSRDTSLVWRLAGLILGGTGLVLLAILVFNHFAQRRLILEMQRARSEALTLAAVNHIEAKLGFTETAVQSAALAWELEPGDRESVRTLVLRTLQMHPQLFGLAVAPVPEDRDSGQLGVVYGFREDGIVRLDDESTAPAQYMEDWFYLPQYLRRPIWTEPYFDEGAKTTMVSFSVPVLRNGRVASVVTGDLSLAWLRQMLNELPLGNRGTAFLLSAQGVYVSHPDPAMEMRESIFSLADGLGDAPSRDALKDLGLRMLGDVPGQGFFKRPRSGERAYISYRRVASTGWAIGVIVPEAEILAPIIQNTRMNIGVGAAGLLLLLLAAVAVAFSLVKPVRRLEVAARQLAGGDFETSLPPVARRDEIGRLTESFEKMRSDLREYIERLTTTTALKEKIASELAIAHQIQLGIVPKLFPPFPHRADLDLHACLEPAREVGGDLYDFALLDEDHLYVAIGDVSGKGVPASLLMAVGKTLMKSTIHAVRDPARTLFMVNDELSEDNDSCMFITAFCGILNLQTGDMTFANAGHNPPLVVRASGQVEALRSTPGPALGVMPGAIYPSQAIRFAPGDLLLLYTDGVTEAMNPDFVMFGDDGLIVLAQRELTASCGILVDHLVAAVHEHAAGAEQSDDITALAVRVNQYPGANKAVAVREADARLALANRMEELPKLVEWLETLGERHAWPATLVMSLNLALEEWFANVVGYAFSDREEHTVHFRLWIKGDRLDFEIEDDGRPFDPTAQAEPDTTAGFEQRPVGGLGIHFIRRVMGDVRYRREFGRNLLSLTACIAEGPRSELSAESR